MDEPSDESDAVRREWTAGEAVIASLRSDAAALADAEPGAVADEPDAVHQARILVRRLRSSLGVYRGLFEFDRVRELRAQLTELGDVLGEVRDAEVRIQFAEDRLAGVTDVAVRRRLVDDERALHVEAHDRMVAYLAAAEGIRASLGSFVDSPPFSELAAQPAAVALARMLRNELLRVEVEASSHGDDLEDLHRVRRAARRLRYAAEAVSRPPAEVFGDDVRELAAAAKELQDELGDHRDATLFAMHVRDAGSGSGSGSSGGSRRVYQAIADAALEVAAKRLAAAPAALEHLRTAAAALG